MFNFRSVLCCVWIVKYDICCRRKFISINANDFILDPLVNKPKPAKGYPNLP